MIISKQKTKQGGRKLIEVKHLTKKYGDFTAVQDVNFHIKKGEIVGLLGPNGAGKSTTMNMITGVIEPTEGEIRIGEYDLLKHPKQAKAQIGYMPEGVPLYNDLTVKEFITYMAELKMVRGLKKKQQIQEVISKTNLVEVQNRLIKNLSRGYKQRVGLAGALVSAPPFLILDEPTVGLDPKQITEIRSMIQDLRKEHTIILSSHILSEVSKLCEKVIIINQGKIVAVDTPQNLESKTSQDNIIKITIEDPKNQFENMVRNMEGIKKLEFVKDNGDGTKDYMIVSEKGSDQRKELFAKCAKEQMTIFELKKSEATLEEAFMKLITNSEEEGNSSCGQL